MSDQHKSSLLGFFRQISDSMFQRIIRGEHNYEQDSQTLNNMIEKAQNLQDTNSQTYLMNTLAVLNAFVGQLEKAYELFHDIYTLHEMNKNISGMANSLLNMGVSKYVLGDYSTALTHYEDGIRMCAKSDGLEKRYNHLLANMGEIHLILKDYEAAELCFLEVLELRKTFSDQGRRDHAEQLADAYRGLAEIASLRGDLESAKSNIALAFDIARVLQIPGNLGTIYFTTAHIAHLQGEENAVAMYLDKGHSTLENLKAPVETARRYLEEANRLAELGLRDFACDFANKAHVIFYEHNRLKDCEKALDIIYQLDNR